MQDRSLEIGRRELLKFGIAGAGAALCGILPIARADEKKVDLTSDPYGGFKMGMQSYSLRGFDAGTALKHTRKLGLKYWESFPAHIPVTTLPAEIKKYQTILSSAGVTLMAYGVVPFNANETAARQLFDFAKAMGMTSLSANPDKDKPTFDLLDKLVAEYDIAVAIHNHGPGATYDKISDVEKAVKDRHPKIGACVDTGHYLRSDEDPMDAIGRLGGRVFGVHLKDVKTLNDNGKKSKRFTVLGQGDLNVVGCLRVLRGLKFDNCVAIEYEENPENPLADIEASLQTVRDAVKKLS